MSKGTKIALITLGVLVVGVGVYMLISKNKTKSGNKEKDDRDIVVKRTKNLKNGSIYTFSTTSGLNVSDFLG